VEYGKFFNNKIRSSRRPRRRWRHRQRFF